MRMDGRTDRQTDRHDVAYSRFSQFCERTRKRIFPIEIFRTLNSSFS